MIKIIDDEKKVGTMQFEDLNVGDTFIYNGELYIKSDTVLDRALNLSKEGDWEEFERKLPVTPVDIKIKIIRKVEF